jgi:hypothetical protein
MDKRIVYMEVNNRTFVDTEGLNSGLKGLAIKAEDSYDFEDILNNAMQSLYQEQPEGKTNYSEESPLVGKVRLCRFNNNQGHGNANVEYAPAGEYKKKWKYIQKTIGTINLRERTFSVDWNEEHNERYYQIPEILMKDTERVMECLGLDRKVKE